MVKSFQWQKKQKEIENSYKQDINFIIYGHDFAIRLLVNNLFIYIYIYILLLLFDKINKTKQKLISNRNSNSITCNDFIRRSA